VAQALLPVALPFEFRFLAGQAGREACRLRLPNRQKCNSNGKWQNSNGFPFSIYQLNFEFLFGQAPGRDQPSPKFEGNQIANLNSSTICHLPFAI
jgi:hypothetical protein